MCDYLWTINLSHLTLSLHLAAIRSYCNAFSDCKKIKFWTALAIHFCTVWCVQIMLTHWKHMWEFSLSHLVMQTHLPNAYIKAVHISHMLFYFPPHCSRFIYQKLLHAQGHIIALAGTASNSVTYTFSCLSLTGGVYTSLLFSSVCKFKWVSFLKGFYK